MKIIKDCLIDSIVVTILVTYAIYVLSVLCHLSEAIYQAVA